MSDKQPNEDVLRTVRALLHGAETHAQDPVAQADILADLETLLINHFGDTKTLEAGALSPEQKSELKDFILRMAKLEMAATARLEWLNSLNQHLIDSLDSEGP